MLVGLWSMLVRVGALRLWPADTMSFLVSLSFLEGAPPTGEESLTKKDLRQGQYEPSKARRKTDGIEPPMVLTCSRFCPNVRRPSKSRMCPSGSLVCPTDRGHSPRTGLGKKRTPQAGAAEAGLWTTPSPTVGGRLLHMLCLQQSATWHQWA